MKADCKGKKERERFIAPEHRGGGLARSVWRPAEHIFTRFRSRMATVKPVLFGNVHQQIHVNTAK